MDTGYAIGLFGILFALAFLSFVLRRSPFTWVVSGAAWVFVGFWYMGAIGEYMLWAVLTTALLTLAIIGAVTGGRG